MRKFFIVIIAHCKLFFSDLLNTKSFFMKNYMSYTVLLLLSFIITGIILMSQISIYLLEDKQSSLSFSVERAKDLTQIVNKSSISEKSSVLQLYYVNMMQIAEESSATILVSDLNSNILFYYDSNNPEQEKPKINSYIVEQTLLHHSYSEIGDLDGFFNELTYINTSLVCDSSNIPTSIVLIGMPATSVINLVADLGKILLLIIFIIMIAIMIISYFITLKITLPLRRISRASKYFAKGAFNYEVCETSNCTEIDDLSKSINNMARSLALSEKNRATFIENVSHELKTPMTSIAGFVDGILDGTISYDKQNYYLDIVSNEVKRLSRLTVRMLQTSRIQSDTFTIKKSPFSLTETVISTVISFENKINAKNLDICISFSQDDITVLGDRDNIYQVVFNLVDNAIKFSEPENQLKININIDQNNAFFSISNKGSTIPPEKLSNLFERFYKADDSRSEDTTGAGLGLFIVKKIINMHDRDITATSLDGLTTFSFSLPCTPRNNKTDK